MSLESELMTLACGDHAKFSAMMSAVMEIAARPAMDGISLGRLWVFHSMRKRGRVKAEDPEDAHDMFDEWMRAHKFTYAELETEIKRLSRDRTESLGEFRVRYLKERGVYEGRNGAATNRARGQASSAELVRRKTRTVQVDMPGAETGPLSWEGTGTLADRF